MLSIAEVTDGVVTHTPASTNNGDNSIAGVRVEQSAESFELSRRYPGTAPVYYRVDYGRLEWASELGAFPAAGSAPEPDPETLLAMVHGLAATPDAGPLPGIRRLAVGTNVRLDAAGVTVTHQPPALPSQRPGRRQSLAQAVEAVLDSTTTDYAIAYSGGLSSAFLAVCALAAGHRPTLLHAELGPDLAGRVPVADVPGLTLRRVRVDLPELFDHHQVSGSEPVPPLPDVELPRLLMTRLAEAAGTTLVSGALMKDLVSARLPEAGAGPGGWRLLGSEPFHIAGTLRTLREARALVASGRVHGNDEHSEPDVQPIDAPPRLSPPGSNGMPGLTERAKAALQTARRTHHAVWDQHLAELAPVLGRVEAGLLERGLADRNAPAVALPAVDPGVLAAVARLAPAKLCGIRGGAFRNHLPLRQALSRHRVAGVPETSPGFRLRLAAASHLHRERNKLIAELGRECAFADLGLVEPATVTGLLRDGPSLAEYALPLLRLIWLDRWLRGR